MEIQEKKMNDVILVYVTGRVDSFTAPKLGDELDSMINAGKQKIIINFQSINYISSLGLEVFLHALKKLSAHQGKIKFSNIPDNVLKVFTISGLDKLFEIYPTETDALEDFKNDEKKNLKKQNIK